MWVVKLVKNHNHINSTGQCLSVDSEVLLRVMFLYEFIFSDFFFQISPLIHLIPCLNSGVSDAGYSLRLKHYQFVDISQTICNTSVCFASVLRAVARLCSNWFQYSALIQQDPCVLRHIEHGLLCATFGTLVAESANFYSYCWVSYYLRFIYHSDKFDHHLVSSALEFNSLCADG